MRNGYIAIRDVRWEDFKEECRVKGKSSEWAIGTIREPYEKVVKKKEAVRLGLVREILGEHGFSEANHCASRWNWSS